ncbi:hypothetical protein [Methylobacillus sp.]|uniref:hypothetical protein n=1 Tax=Methylobacillus sp. TaxID=56818 RepID=UPI0012C84EEA|nr:hypothetical protein [Methylobacillus sp.]MPS48567.1 hypothetical protein [Methylobacillus sp.]
MSGTNNHASKPATEKKLFSPKGHDNILSRVQDAKGFLRINTTSGSVLDGRLVARDRYTITLELTETTHGSNGESAGEVWRETFYKHAIESFREVSGRN